MQLRTNLIYIMSEFGPSFIGVGPEKTGTTWLDNQLRAHPEVFLPPIKELRYFWEKYAFPKESFFQRMNYKKSWHREQYLDYTKERLKDIIQRPIKNLFLDRSRLLWDINYLLKLHDDAWYIKCFQNNSNKISGEISPQYFFRTFDQIKGIHNVIPHSKIIITLRKPIDWVWSFAKMDMKNGFLKPGFGNLDNYIESKFRNCSFSRSLGYWKSLYSEDQILVLFLEDLNADAWNYYIRFCLFLGISPDQSRKAELLKKINTSNKAKMPEEFVDKCILGWKDDIQALSSMVPNIPKSWLN